MLQRVTGDPEIIGTDKLASLSQTARDPSIDSRGLAVYIENRSASKILRQQWIRSIGKTFGKLAQRDDAAKEGRGAVFAEERVCRSSAPLLLQVDQESRVKAEAQLHRAGGGASSL